MRCWLSALGCFSRSRILWNYLQCNKAVRWWIECQHWSWFSAVERVNLSKPPPVSIAHLCSSVFCPELSVLCVEGAVRPQEHRHLPGLHHQFFFRQRLGGPDPHGVLQRYGLCLCTELLTVSVSLQLPWNYNTRGGVVPRILKAIRTDHTLTALVFKLRLWRHPFHKVKLCFSVLWLFMNCPDD